MLLTPNQVFIDFITITQTHTERHQPLNAGLGSREPTGKKAIIYPLTLQLEGNHGTSFQVSSDGNTVTVSGNLSKFNQKDNLFGLPLDQLKLKINALMRALGLPPFTSNRPNFLQDRPHHPLQPKSKKHLKAVLSYTGAVISRLDATINIQTGSPENRRLYQQHQQTQEWPLLDKTLIHLNTVYGMSSKSRKITLYDKGLEILQKQIPKAQKRRDHWHLQHLQLLKQWCDQSGILRFEIVYKRFLRKNNLRQWQNATSESIANQFQQDLNLMHTKIDTRDLSQLPMEARKILGLYLMGEDVKEILNLSHYYKYRKILKEAGFDISNQNIAMLKPKITIIEVSVATPPSWYEMPTAELEQSA